MSSNNRSSYVKRHATKRRRQQGQAQRRDQFFAIATDFEKREAALTLKNKADMKFIGDLLAAEKERVGYVELNGQ